VAQVLTSLDFEAFFLQNGCWNLQFALVQRDAEDAEATSLAKRVALQVSKPEPTQEMQVQKCGQQGGSGDWWLLGVQGFKLTSSSK
jgi:hypothetical protein